MSTAASVLTRSKADLPPPKSKKAPKMFTGHHAEIESFICEFVQMMNLYNIPATECFELITCYVSRRVAEVIEALTEYQRKDWDGLEKQLKKLYNHIKVENATPRRIWTLLSRNGHANCYRTSPISGSINETFCVLEDGYCRLRR